MLRIRIDVMDSQQARVCLFNDLWLVDWEAVPYCEDFESCCTQVAANLKERFEIRKTPLWKKAKESVAELEAKLNANTIGKRGAS